MIICEKLNLDGKGKKDNEWYYGDLLQAIDNDTTKRYFIVTDDYSSKTTNIELHTCQSPEVISETIGQFTGLYDNNKTPIYESDIVEFSYDYFNGNWDAKVLRGTVDFEYGCYYVNVFIIEDEKVSEEYPQCFLLDEVTQDIEVIGNKFDNPDLLGE